MVAELRQAVADTSIFVGFEAERYDAERFKEYAWGVSTITLGELRLGVLRAGDADASARRLSTYQVAFRCEPLPIDERVAEAWALLVSRLRSAGAKAPINDTWIAATAIALGVPVATQDNDYDEMPGLEVIKF